MGRNNLYLTFFLLFRYSSHISFEKFSYEYFFFSVAFLNPSCRELGDLWDCKAEFCSFIANIMTGKWRAVGELHGKTRAEVADRYLTSGSQPQDSYLCGISFASCQFCKSWKCTSICPKTITFSRR